MLWAEVCHRLTFTEPAARMAPILHNWREQAAGIALAANRRLRAPLLVARTQLTYAELLATGEPERARALASEAGYTAEQAGFDAIGRHVDHSCTVSADCQTPKRNASMCR
nr:hypothetical protein Ade03nite_93610 [Actinoplanes derwentensis]